MLKPCAFLAVLLLSACLDPQQACLDRADRDLRVVRNLIDDTEATLARGYAIRSETRIVNYNTFCLGHHGRHNTGAVFCDRTRVVTSRTPIAVDLNVERRKLESLKRKEQELQAKTQSALASCETSEPVSW